METDEVVSMWREQLSDITNCDISVESGSSMSMMSSAFETYEVILLSSDYDELKSVSQTIVDELKERDDITRIHSTPENSAPVIAINVDPVKAKSYGIDASDIGNTVYNMLSGIEATTIETDGTEYDVMVEYSGDSYENLEEVKNIILETGSGGSVALTDVADIAFEDTPASIAREDKQYKVTISGEYTDIADEETSMEIMQEVVNPNLSSLMQREVLCEKIWGMGRSESENAEKMLNRVIHKVRMKLNMTTDSEPYIQTFRREGYCFICNEAESGKIS